MGMTKISAKVGKGKNSREVTFLVDSGATYTLLPEEIWKALRLKPTREVSFSLADGTIIKRNISEVQIEYNGLYGTTPVILGEDKDEALLGVFALETLGLVLNPFTRKLSPMKMMLAKLSKKGLIRKPLKIWTIVLFCVLCIGIVGIAEEIKLTTYYPAPYGTYKEFTTTGNTYLATDTAGKVGIGTTGPFAKLHIQQDSASVGLRIQRPAATGDALLQFSDGVDTVSYIGSDGGNDRMWFGFDDTSRDDLVLRSNGKVGIGTTNPVARLHVSNPAGDGRIISDGAATSYAGLQWSAAGVNKGGLIYDSASDRVDIWMGGARSISVKSDGKVGIGTTNPGYDLEVNGKTKLSQNVGIGGDPRPGANMLDVYGKISTTQGISGAGGVKVHSLTDIAEDILAEGCEAGDVVIIDVVNNEKVTKNKEPFDTKVAGIISTDPAFHIGRTDKEGYLPLALAGRVLCKVTTENGSIERGDLLTTSSTLGHAMKVTDRLKALGAIVGKALEPFEKGPNGEETGKIMVLVTLQ